MLRYLFSADELEEFRKTTSVRRLIEPREIADVIFMGANMPVLNGALLDANYLG
jgi:hypothetical protein